MALGNLRAEERVGLVVAIALHAALLAMFLLRPTAATPPPPQRISVTLSPDAGLNATAPTHDDAAADLAPTLGTPPPAKVATPPVEKPVPAPKPVAIAQPRPEPVKAPAPAAKPLPIRVTPPRHALAKPDDTPAPPVPAPARPARKHEASVKNWALAMPTTPDHHPAGGSRIGNDFLKGVAGGKPSGKAAQQGAAVIGPEVKSALSGAIAHQLKPHWVAPQGADADQLVTVLSWDLNPDGTLAGPPQVVRQEGITDSNRPQAARHAEQAIRAVELGAPFKLPAEYYGVWKHVRSFEFNRTLSQ